MGYFKPKQLIRYSISVKIPERRIFIILTKKCFYGIVSSIYRLSFRLIGSDLWRLWSPRFKKRFNEAQLKSFETGVKYQMYHALLLLMLSFNLNLETTLEKWMVYFFIIGTFLFSFSIYALTLSASKGRKLKFLGPVTPVGGLLLVIGWGILLYLFIRNIV